MVDDASRTAIRAASIIIGCVASVMVPLGATSALMAANVERDIDAFHWQMYVFSAGHPLAVRDGAGRWSFPDKAGLVKAAFYPDCVALGAEGWGFRILVASPALALGV